jgi:DMSO/TMAO reductase YedYZ molybdopterin-dependent catalytic subunit
VTYQDPHPERAGRRNRSGPSAPRTASSERQAPGRAALVGAGAVVGIVTTLVALGVAQLVAAVLGSPIGEPIPAVGEMSINNTPATVKNFAIREFGSSDKTVLVWGIRGVLIIFAIIIGALAIRRLWLGLAGLAVFAGIGIYAALSQPTAKSYDVLPTVIGAVVAAFALRHFSRVGRRVGGRLVRPAVPPASAASAAAAQPAAPAPTAAPSARAAQAPPASASPSAQPAPGASSADREDQAESAEPARSAPPGAAWWPAEAVRADAAQEPPPSRRRFLLTGAVVAGGSLISYVGGSWLANTRDVTTIQQALKLPKPTTPAPPLPPGTDLKIGGLSTFVTPNSSFYRVDTAIVMPEVLPAHWQLRIHGMVRREIVLTFDDLLRRPLMENWITLCCVSNPVAGPYIGNAKWLGASLRSLLQEAGIKAGADQLLCSSSDGFTSGTPVQTAMDGRDALLAVGMNDAALPVEHGFPARLVIPGLYGYVSACKWIVDIEVTTYAANQAYWVPRGWAPQAPVKTESRIDVPTGNHPIKAGKHVSIAGVAWAQHKGIEAVEVRIGKGPWQQARLAAVPGIDCWRQWVYDWHVNAGPGNYLIEARATDKTGYTQTSLQEPPEPNGASGYPAVSVNVVR